MSGSLVIIACSAAMRPQRRTISVSWAARQLKFSLPIRHSIAEQEHSRGVAGSVIEILCRPLAR